MKTYPIDKYFADYVVNHYTPARRVQSILENGFKGGNLSMYLDEDDSLKMDQYDLSKLKGKRWNKEAAWGLQKFKYYYDKALKETEGMSPQERKKYLNKVLPKDWKLKSHMIRRPDRFRYLVNYGNTDGLVGSENISKEDGSEGYYNEIKDLKNAPVRLVTKVSTDDNTGYVIGDTNRIRKGKVNDWRSDPEVSFDLGESRVTSDDLTRTIDPDKIKIQIPFGAVDKDNALKYERYLAGIDPSRFDVNDKYTRRIYNKWARENGKDVLPGSERYSIVYDVGTKTFSIKRYKMR